MASSWEGNSSPLSICCIKFSLKINRLEVTTYIRKRFNVRKKCEIATFPIARRVRSSWTCRLQMQWFITVISGGLKKPQNHVFSNNFVKTFDKKSLEIHFPRKQTLIPCRRIGRAEGGEGVREVVKDWEDSNVEPTRTITGTTLVSASGKPQQVAC